MWTNTHYLLHPYPFPAPSPPGSQKFSRWGESLLGEQLGLLEGLPQPSPSSPGTQEEPGKNVLSERRCSNKHTTPPTPSQQHMGRERGQIDGVEGCEQRRGSKAKLREPSEGRS